MHELGDWNYSRYIVPYPVPNPPRDTALDRHKTPVPVPRGEARGPFSLFYSFVVLFPNIFILTKVRVPPLPHPLPSAAFLASILS